MEKKNRVQEKSKTAGVLLTFFFGVLGWIYVYKLKKTQFWIGLIVALVFGWTIVVPICIALWAFIDMCVTDKDKFENYSKWI